MNSPRHPPGKREALLRKKHGKEIEIIHQESLSLQEQRNAGTGSAGRLHP